MQYKTSLYKGVGLNTLELLPYKKDQ